VIEEKRWVRDLSERVTTGPNSANGTGKIIRRPMKEFDQQTLAEFDGRDGKPLYIARDGKKKKRGAHLMPRSQKVETV
jgi:hypothetical protein